MDSIRRTAIVPLALLAIAAGCSRSGPDDRSIERLEEAIKAFYESVATDDVEGRLALFDAEAVMLPDGGHLIQGHDAIAAVLRSGEGYQFRIDELERLETVVDSGIAYTVNRYVYTYHPIGEEPVWHPTRNVHIWKRQPDGSWRLHLDLWQNGVGTP